MKKLFLAGVLAASMATWAENLPQVPYPAGFRRWQHVKSIVVGPESPTFAKRGGIHHYYANAEAVDGYRTGKFPEGSVIVDEGVFTRDGQGMAKGIVLEGERRRVEVMVKNSRLYRDTGGWGFEAFEGDEQAGKLQARGRAECHTCHSEVRER
ncbi:MAG TPA: cytochrome P460 family protein, partial [Bryobacteraceae bacterium]|nr:cytochrome P460 family protein [Bryobacteraceae bacterium]